MQRRRAVNLNSKCFYFSPCSLYVAVFSFFAIRRSFACGEGALAARASTPAAAAVRCSFSLIISVSSVVMVCLLCLLFCVILALLLLWYYSCDNWSCRNIPATQQLSWTSSFLTQVCVRCKPSKFWSTAVRQLYHHQREATSTSGVSFAGHTAAASCEWSIMFFSFKKRYVPTSLSYCLLLPFFLAIQA